MRSPLDEAVVKAAFIRFCNKSCPIMWTKDHAGYDSSDEISEMHCDNCIVKTFIETELEISMKF